MKAFSSGTRCLNVKIFLTLATHSTRLSTMTNQFRTFYPWRVTFRNICDEIDTAEDDKAIKHMIYMN